MTNTPRFPPKRRVAVAIYPGFQILDAAGPIAAFEIATRFVRDCYEVVVIASDTGLVRSSSGVSMPAQTVKGLNLARFDTLIGVGGMGVREAANDPVLVGAFKRGAQRCRRVASVCSGSFLLAVAGLLDGKTATTHWRQAALMQRLFPNVRVEADRIYVREGDIWTSAGVTAGIDLALAMIADDYGAEVASNVAREMVVYAQRPGGQAQHSALLDLGGGEKFASLNAWIRANLDADLSVEALAARVAMSPRNFARAYAAETGVTPAKAVERLRVEGARGKLEAGAAIQEAARLAGFGDPERMRRAFIRLYGAPPAALRRTLRRA
ncbi:MAG: GlxA family transcriptional regulator [Hyphomonadaceae bacterium]|nr:GlxA family transcriptional regulator [Hyphomonadaceae bacterium]